MFSSGLNRISSQRRQLPTHRVIDCMYAMQAFFLKVVVPHLRRAVPICAVPCPFAPCRAHLRRDSVCRSRFWWLEILFGIDEGVKTNTQAYIKMLAQKCYHGSLKVLVIVTSLLKKTVLRPTHRIWPSSGAKIILAYHATNKCGLPQVQTSTQWTFLPGPS